jgi:uncharacterized protein (DUF58 family)
MQNLLLFIIGLFVIAAIFRVDFFFYLLYILFGVYFLSRVWAERVLGHVSLRREYTDRAFAGERVTVHLSVRNESILPVPWLRLHESLPVQLKAPNFFRSVLSLLPHEEARFSYELDCRRRGYYSLGPLSLSTGDLFGMRNHEVRSPRIDHLLVYPRIIPLTKLSLPAQTPFGSIPTKQHIYEDPSRMVGVRAYQSGDSLRNIHWKTTAAMGVLQVKRFEPAISIESQVFLNLNRGDYTMMRVETATELGIVVAASIAQYLLEKRQTVGLSTNGVDPLDSVEVLVEGDTGRPGMVDPMTNGARLPRTAKAATEMDPPKAVPVTGPVTITARKGREQLMQILSVLARIQVSEGAAFVDLVRQASLHMSWGGTGIIITAHADDSLFGSMLAMKRSGFHVVLVLLDPRAPFPLLKERAEQVGIRAYQIWQESDLDVWR